MPTRDNVVNIYSPEEGGRMPRRDGSLGGNQEMQIEYQDEQPESRRANRTIQAKAKQLYRILRMKVKSGREVWQNNWGLDLL